MCSRTSGDGDTHTGTIPAGTCLCVGVYGDSATYFHTKLVNLILNETCHVNLPAAVSLNDNSIFPLFPCLIISKKLHNLLRLFRLKSTDTVWGISAWIVFFQSYKHLKTGVYDGTRILSNVTETLLQLCSLETTIHTRGSVLGVPCLSINYSICGSKSGDLLL